MLNVLIITQNEPFFIPKMIKYLIEKQGLDYSLKAVTLLKPHRKNKNYFHWLRERAQVYNLGELFISSLAFSICKLNNKFDRKSSFSVSNYLKINHILELNTNDINSDNYINELKKLSIDIIISISCPQLFKDELLKAAKYSINAHGTLLPRHRGVFGSWWTLFSGDKVAGSTIHTMELRLDAGNILWQKVFNVEKSDTQYSLAYKTKRDMSFGIVEVLKNIFTGRLSVLEPSFESSYHRAPTKEQGKEFHKKGLHIIKLRDLKLVLSKSF